ncbi:MAG: glycosyl hydrolase [Gammaproteobacteria bacterium]
MSIPGVGLEPGNALIVATRFLGHIIHHAVRDPRNPSTIVASAVTGHLGPTVFRSEDAGRTWNEAVQPPAFDKAGPGQNPRVVKHTFWLTPGHRDEPGVWYAGSSPQALWRSADDGATWESVRGFNDHEDYELRTEDPQAGTPDGPIMHSILIDPRDARHMYLGLSGGGVYESHDQGESWAPLNQGMAHVNADPNSDTGFGVAEPASIQWQEIGPQHDPHCVQMHPANPDVLVQQNHCGIYRIERPADTWVRVGRNMPEDVGDIGFVVGLHPRDTDTCWVFPMDGTDVWPRTSPDGKPAAYVSRDAGASWQRQDNGLPARGWFTVKRQAMSVDSCDSVGVYFGTTSGEVWGSVDEGESWQPLVQHLPEIYAVEVATVA